jgi:N-acetylglucosaminyldiphosphoundecaprenol N-acetyl-beta-D-mannosaminyltransferase
LGVRVDATDYTAATSKILQWARQGESRYVCEAPVAMVMESYDSAEYRAVINGADLVTPGGMPIVWMMRRLGVLNQQRVYGPTLSLHVCEAAARQGIPVGFYGGTEKAATLFAKRMQERYCGLKVTYLHSPPFRPPTVEEKKATLAKIRLSGCLILFVGLGCPKQEQWMAEHRGKLPVVMLGVGAAFDFVSGQKPQAYLWMQRLGLEWLFRFVTEPRRLWFRYLYHNPRFIVLALWQLVFARRFHPPEGAVSRLPNPDGRTRPETPWAIDVHSLEQSLAGRRVQLWLKRMIDVVGATTALLLLTPAFLLTALLIRCTSPGPVIFRQGRVGFRGREFTLYKFRSMRVENDPALIRTQQVAASKGILVKGQDDPRVTAIGGILRATSFDELPQLINVLKGDMSLVGPRPLVPFMLGPYPEFACARALMRPGLTGLWQVRGRENNTSAASMMTHDLDYIRRFNLTSDFAILLDTVRAVISRKGAC